MRPIPTTWVPVFTVLSALTTGCSNGPSDRLQGKWVGESIDNIPEAQQARATGWVRATSFEFTGDRVTVAIPAAEPRTGTYKVESMNGKRMTLRFDRPSGESETATVVLAGDRQLKWEIGDERAVTFTKVAMQ